MEIKKMNTNKETYKLFWWHFKNTMSSKHTTIRTGGLDGMNGKNKMSITFVMSHTSKISRITALRELETFIQDFNNQKEKTTGFVMSVVTTDYSALEDTIKIELDGNKSLGKKSSYNMTFNVEGISETDLPYIYEGVVNIG
tara:strand:+ start:1291 stop:1713 length:423 start_codon:yes stop_codon:yes gene_type:complete